MFIIAGPCVVESKELLFETAEELSRVCGKHNLKLYFKSSYKKANRSNVNSFTGIGDELALSYIKEVSEHFELETITDVHETKDVKLAENYVDVLQIPAFLSRQTDLLISAGESGKAVNIKKAQFMSPYDMESAANKVKSTGNNNIWLTERGTFFGYNNLVVDFRSILIMKEFGYPVVYDATHSLQRPSIGVESGGEPRFALPLAKAAMAVGASAIFFETHPNPKQAKSDSAVQIKLRDVEDFVNQIMISGNL